MGLRSHSALVMTLGASFVVMLGAAVGACHPPERRPVAAAPIAPITPTPVSTALPTSPPAAPSPDRARRALAQNVPDEIELTVRDPRFYKRRKRPPTLLEHQINVLLPGLAAPERPGGVDPEVLLELAHAYAELAHVTPRFTVEHDTARDEARAAYSRYAGLVPDSDGADGAAYFVALEYELDGAHGVATAAYRALIAQRPDAWIVPYCHFGLAELALERAVPLLTKRELEDVLAHYEAALAKTKHAGDLYPWTLLRIGQLQMALADAKRAKATFARLRREFPSSDAVDKLEREPLEP